MRYRAASSVPGVKRTSARGRAMGPAAVSSSMFSVRPGSPVADMSHSLELTQ